MDSFAGARVSGACVPMDVEGSTPREEKKSDVVTLSLLVEATTQHLVPKVDMAVMSPYSVTMLLLLLRSACNGNTRKQINTFFHLDDDIDETIINRIVQEAISKCPSNLKTANSVWMHPEWEPAILPSFKQHAQDVFAAMLGVAHSPQDVNSWVKRATQGRISQIVATLPPNLVAILLNAVTFDGEWFEEFSESDYTRFVLADGKICDRKFMAKWRDDWQYHATPADAPFSYEAVEIKYKQDGFSVLLVLPGDAKAQDHIFQTWSADTLDQYLKPMEQREGTVTMPQFKIKSDESLLEPLQKCGLNDMTVPFTADLSKLCSRGGVFVSNVQHGAVLGCDVKGVSAAAYTSADCCWESCVQKLVPDIKMVVDRPFLFVVLRDRQYCVFHVRVTDPTILE